MSNFLNTAGSYIYTEYKNNKSLVWIIIIGILMYGPISFFILGLKGDALNVYFPYRFFISESIKSGYLPLWNPYSNFGFPQYADMNGSYWSPIVWLLAMLPGEAIYHIQMETVLYILLGGLGMFVLGQKTFGWKRAISLTAAITYMGCGYYIGHIQHINWISPAAFLPWCIWSIYNVITPEKNLKRILVGVLWMYLYISSAHPDLIIQGIYFYGALSFYLLYKNRKIIVEHKKIFRHNVFLFMTLLLGLLIGIAYAYADILPYTSRFYLPELETFYTTNVKSLISFLLPAISNSSDEFFKNYYPLRNCYFGIIPLILMILAMIYHPKRYLFWFIIGIIFLILSTDLSLVYRLRNYLPLTNYIRISGSFRLYSLLCFIIISFDYINNTFNQDFLKHSKSILLIISLFVGFYILVISYASYQIYEHEAWQPFLAFLHAQIDLKSFMYEISFDFFADFSALWAISILSLFIFWLRKNQLYKILILIGLDLFVSVCLQMPYTGTGSKTLGEIQAMLNKSPKGFPIPPLDKLATYDYANDDVDRTLGGWSLYNKRPGTIKRSTNPLPFRNEYKIFEETSMDTLREMRFLNVYTTGQDSIKLTAFTPNGFTAEIQVSNPWDLTVLYKRYPHWEFSLNGKALKPDNKNQIFFSFENLPKGKNLFVAKFEPKFVIFGLLWTAACWAVLVSSILFLRLRGDR